jgi:indole-3-acetate monooxygenase
VRDDNEFRGHAHRGRRGRGSWALRSVWFVHGDGLQTALGLVDEIAPVVTGCASESEHLGRLAPAVVDALHDTGLFRLLVPAPFGGLGLTIPESVAVFERVGGLDAATGWTLTILGDGPLLARFLAPTAFEEICADTRGLLCGSLNPATARAEPVDDGYVFSGRATYLSGSSHSRWVMAGAIVMRDGAPVLDDGRIQIRAGVFPIEHAQCLDTWHVAGMRATGSSDYAFDGVEVPADWTFAPLAPRADAADDDVFRHIPLWSQLGGGLAANAVGAARNMLEHFATLAAAKVPVGGNPARLAERGPAQLAMGEAHGLYLAARAVLMQTVDAVWARGSAREPFGNDVLASDRLGIVTAVQLAARAIDLLHDAAGMSAVVDDSVLDRCWRDVHTITQHVILTPARYEIGGRVLLGLDPGSPVI